MSKTLRKMMCAVLSAALCFSNLNITAISADTVLDSQTTAEDILISDGSEENGTDLILDDGSDAVISDGLEETGTDRTFENQGENAASGEEENTIYEPVNRIHETEQVGVKLTGWWYKNAEGEKRIIETTSSSEENQTTVVCDLSQIEEDGFSEAGFDLSFAFLKEGEERTVQASDYLSFTLPACFKELSVTGAQEDYYTYALEEQEDHSYKMTVTFQTIPETPDLSGTIHMAFSLQETMENKAGSTCLIVLQGNKADPMASVSCEVIFPEKPEEENVVEDTEENGEETAKGDGTDVAQGNVEESAENSEEGNAEESAEDSKGGNVEEGAENSTEGRPDNSAEENLEEEPDEAAVPMLLAVGDNGVETSEGTENNTGSSLVSGEFSVSGSIKFDETLNGTDWRDLVRPNEFDTDNTFKIVLKYMDENGDEQSIETYAQENLSTDDFYLKFTHDGEGGGDFVIEHVPKTVTVGEKVYQVARYEINIEPKQVYYQNNNTIIAEFETVKDESARVLGELELSLKYETLTLNPTVVPDEGSDNPTFRMNATFTNTITGNITATGGKTISYSPSKNTPSIVQVPLGISYQVTQNTTSGYKFDGNYTTTTTTEGVEGSTSDTSTTAAGMITQGTDVTITTVNYAQNLTVGFNVEWIDNNSATRPASLSKDNFVLQFKKDGEWIALTEEWKDFLGIDTMPAFDASKALLNQYSFTGLPAVDSNGNTLEYQVVVNQAPTGYTSSFSDGKDGKRTFTFVKTTRFTANIYWNDASNAEGKRPSTIDGLKLYRKAGNGNYVQVYGQLPEGSIYSDGNHWSVSMDGLARYDANNKEYDYVLVQGSIDENGNVVPASIENYKTYYDNGSGSYGNDVALCHNNGEITEVLYDKVDFSANKVWKDPSTELVKRPDVKMTLWRYVENEAENLDDAYENGKAAQVVFQTVDVDNKIQENIVSYSITSGNNETIVFDASKVSGLSANYEFPRYDDQGRKYVYFVRETISGSDEDNYEIQYRDANGTTYSNGTLSGGTVTNVRREKAAVAIKKLWQNPANLASIAGSVVQMKISASADGGTTYKELTVYSEALKSYDELTGDKKDEAQTTTGFTSSISSAEVIYYVNIYDDEGRLYDMSNATIQEIITKDGTTVTWNEDGIFTMGTDTYQATTEYKTQDTLGDGTKQFHYIQKNTITGNRNYTVEKNWADSISKDGYSDIASITFTLMRRTTKDNSNGTPASFVPVDDVTCVVSAEEDRTWTEVLENLPKYDQNGYEYEYIATEVSFTKKDGSIFTTTDAYNTKGWSVEYYRTSVKTTATNYIATPGSTGFFQVSKEWVDNGDIASRKAVTVRVYYRSKLLEALSEQQGNKSDDEYVDLSSLADYYECTISNDNQSRTNISYGNLYASTGSQNAEDKDNWQSYIVLEYLVGSESADGATPARYTYGDLKAAAATTNTYYSLSGTVENSSRLYKTQASVDTSNNRGHVIITNTRIGSTDIRGIKIWYDGSNSSSNRPSSVSFQLYQDGNKYTSVPDTVTISGTGAVLDRDTGVITISNVTGNEWSFDLKGLPMFSSHALPHSYDVEEEKVTVADSTVSYIQKKGAIVVTGDNKKQSYSFSYSNTITGTISHTAYKYWKDPDSYAANRPDLYMRLYQYIKNDESPVLTFYTDYKNQIWTAGTAGSSTTGEGTSTGNESTGTGGGTATDDVTGYNWKITVDDLPRFDEYGNEYGYVFQESMNNGGQTVLGKYIPTSEIKTGTDGSTYEVFTNVIQDYMTVNGFKTWTGLAGYYTSNDDLPNPLISLYRTTDSSITNLQNFTDSQINEKVSNGDITLADTTRLNAAKTTYSFPDSSHTESETGTTGLIEWVDGKAMLPKFDQEGNMYTYLVRETIEDPIASQLYSETNANGTLANVFRDDVNRRSITVTKNWDFRNGLKTTEDKYPSVTYKLYRYEAGKSDTEAVLIETHKINSDEFSANGTASYKFDDLLVYSPTGVQYCYYIEETAISGYTISYADEDAIINENSGLVGQYIVTGPNTKQEITQDWISQLKNNNRIDVISLPEQWNVKNATDTNVAVSTCNQYDQKGSIRISGEKNWDDYNNSEGIRPTSITVTLTRHTDNETGQNNKVESTPVTLLVKDAVDNACTDPYIVWSNTNTSKWTYTIYNLERYAPNGRPYIYTLSEAKIPGYKQASSVTATANSDAITMGAITNCFEGSYYVRKNWMDGYNKYNLRPLNITVDLERSKDNGVIWKTYQTVTLTSQNVISNTRNSSWQHTFTNLPTNFLISKNEETGEFVLGNYLYRCVEKKIGGVPVETKEQKLVAGAYECTYTIQTETRTVIENTLDSTSLLVKKEWQGDQENLYDSRPEKLTFVLQKRGIKVANDNNTGVDVTVTPSLEESQLSEWENVKLANGDPYTFTISAAENWTKTLEDLPVATVVVDEQGNSYTVYSLYFRAVEVHADDSESALGTKPTGALNYKDITDYGNNSSDHIYNTQQLRNESTIKNELILDVPAKSVRVNKTWRRVDGDPVTATFELLYKTASETNWHCYGEQVLSEEQILSDDFDWTSHTSANGCKQKSIATTDTNQTITWTDLPKYDRNGDELFYKVVEHPIDNYKTEIVTNEETSSGYATEYTFTNIELQSYTVKKIWQNEKYAEKTDQGFTATFQLQQKIDSGDWTDVKGQDPITLTSTEAKDETKTYTWKNLPKYTTGGETITYCAIETKINGKNVENNTNGSYMVSYTYDDNTTEPSFKGTETTVTNRMIYGFVNLSKTAAYLAPGITENGGNLAGVKFNIYAGTDTSGTPYVSNVVTDNNGNLVNNGGKYGTEEKYLISGTYTLKESETGADYSVWADGVQFVVGAGKMDGSNLLDTGEHGTAWIKTATINTENNVSKLQLETEYISSTATSHTIGDGCTALKNNSAAVNLESRGVLTFTKTGPYSEGTTGYTDLDTHQGAAGESTAYFGVYLEEACTTQIAGMVPSSTDKTKMILTDKSQNGTTTLVEHKDASGVPYLRGFGTDGNDVYPDYLFTLLSGTYYIKELVAPAGYKLDNTVRKVVVPKIQSTSSEDDLSSVYPNNKAQVMLLNEASGSDTYEWSNEPNVVKLYKRDQYGRIVTLENDGYLELKVEGDGNKFPSGESTIRLYQNTTTPATKIDGTTGITGYISYDVAVGAWTITGLFDIGKIYTLSEPESSVPGENIVANLISFRMKADGSIEVISSVDETESKNDPLVVKGDDYKNYYKSDSGANVMVMLDVSRYLKDVALEKKNSATNNTIPNISFKLYKYDGKDESTGELKNVKPVLEENVYLTTDQNGKIDLENLNQDVKNLITGYALKYGLDVGKYYFREVERGASDQYRLVDDIFFEIMPTANPGTAPDYSDYATVTFDTTDSHVSQNPADGKTGMVTNDPVTKYSKTLNLSKVDSETESTKLAGARFTLTYKSVTHGDAGSVTSSDDLVTWNCITNVCGVLYLTNEAGTISEQKPDISLKGSYVLKEIQAPDDYMTRTEDETDNVVTIVTFDVDSSNQIANVKYYDGQGNLVNGSIISNNETGEHISLDLTVKNEKTIVSVAKRNDIETNETNTDTKTCNQESLNGELLTGAELKIYEGVRSTDSGEPVVTLNNNNSEWTLPAGTLKENTIYTLHESVTPVGYLPADDIYFKLFGTTMKDGKIISQLYVWTGSDTPTVDGNSWSKITNINSNVLTMVDEAVIAPVDMQKVIGDASSPYKILSGAEFAVYEQRAAEQEGQQLTNVLLGTAVSGSNGYIVWKSITEEGYSSKRIFNADGKRVTSTDSDSVIGKTIILQQNTEGYTFTETYAPDNAYNTGESYTVKIKDQNYRDYKKSTGGYNTDSYVDILAASKNTGNTVNLLSVRDDTNNAATAGDLVNPPFKTTFQLYKYDAENSSISADHNNYEAIGMKGVTFTLYKKKTDGETVSFDKVGDYITGENGLLSFDILEKGTYKLVETNTLTGYELNAKELIFTIVNSDYQKTLTYSEEESNSNHTTVINDSSGTAVAGAATYDLPNYRKHGTVTLTKQDANSGLKLNGVKYTLTRTDPAVNTNVDKYFPATVQKLTVETGWEYANIAEASQENEIVKTDIRTTDQGVLILKDLQWGNYTLVELQENDGYILEPKTLTFTISANGLNQKVVDEGKEYVGNTKNRLTLKKTALDGTTALFGAEFTLYPVTITDDGNGGTIKTMGTNPVSFYASADAISKSESTTITAGETTIYGLSKGTYVLRETKAPDGYELAKDVVFTMSANGVISGVTTCNVGADNRIAENTNDDSVVTVDTNGAGTSDAHSTLTVKDTPILASLTKVLKDGDTPVEINNRGNATFVIKGIFADSNGQEVEKTFTSNTITTELDAKLIGGKTYTIKETAAPAGFEVQKEQAVIRVGKDGRITVKQGDSFLTLNNVDGTAVMTFTDQPIELNLKKVDDSGQEIAESTLGYAIFDVKGEFVTADGSGKEHTTISNLTTQNFTAMLSKRIISGETYTVTETLAPNGFRLTATFTFTVDSYGNIQSLTGSDADGNDTEILTITNHPNTITFVKMDEGGNLAGAKFTLTAEDSSVTQAFVNITVDNQPVEATTWTNTKIQWISTNIGTTITNHLIADMRYKLSEERVLNHEVMKNDIVFHVEKDGTVVIDTNSLIPNNSGEAASINGTVMTIRNPLIKGTVVLKKYFTSQKKDSYTVGTDYQQTNVLEGAVYELYCTVDKDGVDHSSSPIQVKTDENNVYNPSGTKTKFTTGSDGKITITNLPEGKYYFVEVDAPKAYYIDSTKISFEIHNDNEAATAVHAVDPRINASISLKKFSEETVFNGAAFDVAYSETQNDAYTSIGTMTTGTDGIANLTQGIYPGSTTPETLRRGFYRLTELSADGQMLNTTDGTRNTISFEIGNTPDKEYKVKSDTDVVYTLGGIYIRLSTEGVVDTPIPTKNIQVTKQWLDDNGMTTTFRPESIQVRLYRTYNGGSEEAVGDSVTLSTANNWNYTWANLPSYVNIEANTGTNTNTTYLYTYTVKEVDSKNWYTVTYEYDTETGNTTESGVKDGNTNAIVKNALNGASEASRKKLTINKALGGGSNSNEFSVRVKLSDGSIPIGNSDDGYYLDSCTVTGGSTTTVTPDSNGWMTIHGGETITVILPNNVTYEVEEKTDNSGNAVVVSGGDYVYTPRYDGNQTGTITIDTATVIRNAVHKSIKLAKVDESNTSLDGAEFTVIYEPGTNTVNPEAVGNTWTKDGCKVSADGKLRDSAGAVLDITQQGTYTIMETKAPEGYITPTDNDGNPIKLAVITVDNQDIMTVAKGADTNAGVLVTLNGDSGLSNDGSVADITVKNEKTKARIGKTIDYAKNNSNDTAEGSYLAGAKMQILGGTAVQVEWTTDASNNPFITSEGLLKEGIVYTLHEESAPNGYKKAADQYFKLSGTYTTGDDIRYSRIIMTDADGNVLQDQNTNGINYGDPGVVDGILNMADETIIAPVDLQKVLEDYTGTSWTALKDVVFTVTDGSSVQLGTAITNDKGYLVWKSITADGYASGLIYDADGHIITSGGIGTGIILRQNESGYVFTESYAPDHVYNDGRSYHVSITEANYSEYRTDVKTGTLYQTDKYINLVESEKETANNYQVTDLSTRGNQTNYTSGDDTTKLAVNLPYKSTVTLHKYDADEEANKANIPGTEFTLYRGPAIEANIYKKAYSNGALNDTGVFTTDADGKISIEIHEKGTYILQETKAATGYQLDALHNTFTFTLVDTASEEQNAAGTYGYNKTNSLQRETAGVKDPDGVPNDRLKGQVTLTKKDDKTAESLDGVVYTLTRTDTPKDEHGNDLTDYLLKQSVDVITGKSYSAEKVSGVWKLTESDGISGTITITGLNWGSYTLTEKTELPGYKLELDTGGQAVNTYSFTVDGKTNQLEFTDDDTNTKNSVTFYKTNQIDSEAGVSDTKPLAGAVFEVHEGDGTGCSGSCVKASFYASDTASKDNTVTSVTTDTDGKVTIYGLATDTTGNTSKTYHLVETIAPKGYKLQTIPTVFTINRQGKVQMKDTNGTFSDASQVTMQDEPIKLYIQKLGEDASTVLKGAEFSLTDICTDGCDHKLANGADSETIIVTAENGKVMIPIERVIGGHTYKLKETKAPDGYECTAEVTFTVKTDGTIENLNSFGGYKGTSGTEACASLDANKTTINIRDEKIRTSLTKVDYEDGTTPLEGVTFTLKPMDGSSFASGYDNTGLTYNGSTNTYTFTTDSYGRISFPEGLLKHDNSYLLKETATINGYYLGKEAKDGVILKIGKDGGITIQRLDAYKDNTIGTDSSCPVTVSATGNSELISKNMKSTSFDLTKLVEGNMGDLNGTFQIKMEVYEPDGTIVGEKTVRLKLNETYDSVTGFNGADYFGENAIPVGATLVITEDNELDYAAVLRIISTGGNATEIATGNKGTVKLTLDTATKVSLELVNTKNVAIDVGVNTENQSPWASLALLLPAVWLAYRYRRKRRGGEY